MNNSVTLTEIITKFCPRNLISELMYNGIEYVSFILDYLKNKSFEIESINESNFPYYVLEHYDSKTNYLGEKIKSDNINNAASNSTKLVFKCFLNIKRGVVYEVTE